MMSYIWIAIGSAIGGAARYWCTGFAARLLVKPSRGAPCS